MPDFVSTSHYDASHPEALAIYCSDGRFTNAVQELVWSLGFDRLDTLTLPGGPAHLHAVRASLPERTTLTEAARFLIHGHHLKEVVLLAHHGCGHYRSRYLGDSPAELEARQVEDLRAAARALKSIQVDMSVEAFFARPRDGRIHFEPVELGGIELSRSRKA